MISKTLQGTFIPGFARKRTGKLYYVPINQDIYKAVTKAESVLSTRIVTNYPNNQNVRKFTPSFHHGNFNCNKNPTLEPTNQLLLRAGRDTAISHQS